MIDENRLKHMIGVARRCYSLAKDEFNMDEEKARQMWLMGLLHDIGYEFMEDEDIPNHPIIGFDILSIEPERMSDISYAILNHGETDSSWGVNDYILNLADMTVDSKGNDVTLADRCRDIEERYGRYSVQSCKALNMVSKINAYGK